LLISARCALRFLGQQVLSAYFAKGAVEYGNIVLDAEPHTCILIEDVFPRRFLLEV